MIRYFYLLNPLLKEMKEDSVKTIAEYNECVQNFMKKVKEQRERFHTHLMQY